MHGSELHEQALVRRADVNVLVGLSIYSRVVAID
jgi:hypothetical protein